MMLSIRESLGGSRLFSVRHGLVLIAPTAGLVVLQESSTAFSSGWLVVLTALLQHLAAFVVLLAVPLLHQWRAVIPLPVVFAVLTAAGVARGLIGGLFAAEVAGADPHFAWRVLAWVLVSLMWLPVLVYAEAQLRHHPVLLAAWYTNSAQLAVETVRASRSYTARRESVVRAVRDTVIPVITEIQTSMGSIVLTAQSLESLSARLASVHAEAVTVIESEPDPVEPHAISMLEPHAVEALGRFHRTRSVYVSCLSAAMLLSVLVPSALLLGTVESAVRAGAVVAITGVVLAACLAAVSRWRQNSILPVVLAVAVAALAGGVAMAVLRPFDASIALGVALGYPVVVAIAAGGLATAIGAGLSNQRLADRIAAVAIDTIALDAASAVTERQVRSQVAALLHGPVLGRLSACVMALNFHASGNAGEDAERTAEVTSAVMAHLALAAADLESLSNTP